MTYRVSKIRPVDARTIILNLRGRMISCSAVLIGVGILAGYVPARRASRVNPLIALRAE